LRAIVVAAIVSVVVGSIGWLLNRVMVGELLEVVVNLAVFLVGPVLAGFVAAVVSRRPQGVAGAVAGYVVAVAGLPLLSGDRSGPSNTLGLTVIMLGGLVVGGYFFALALQRPVLVP
jgi:hypothetical protein